MTRRLGLRARVGVALVGVAVLTVGLTTLLSDRGLEPLVEEAAQSRLERSAEHMAELAMAVYRDEGGWTAAARTTLQHLSELDGLRILVRSGDARFGSELEGAATARKELVMAGRSIGTIEVAQEGAGLLTPEEAHLKHALDRLHLVAGAVSVVAALILALVLAETLSRPLRRIRAGADRIGQGDLTTRVDPEGDREVRSVAHALNRLAETLQHEEEIRKQTVADLAHELRAPVHSLLARIEATQDEILRGPDNLEAMHQEVTRLTRLLDDLARLADAERPGLLLDMECLDLVDIARTAETSFGPQFAEAEIAFEVEATPVWVEGNLGRLEQVAANLLANALRYTPPGGAVTLRVARHDADAILEVEDTGVGIAADEHRHIFTRFWRGDPSRSPATGGTGIGLAIVRELVRAHGGRVDVDSSVGTGSRFRVVLPAVEPTEAVERATTLHSHRP